MKNKILSICIGTNNGNLCGSNNDSIIFYNFLYKLYKNNNYNEYWIKPQIINRNLLCIDDISSKIKNFKFSFKYLLIFYSGHGFKDGILNIIDKDNGYSRINDTEFMKHISNAVSQEIELYLILDSCFGGTFKILPFKNIKRINLISSTQATQEASEGITTIEQIKKIFNKISFYHKLNLTNKSLVMGIFTYNIIYLLDKLNFISINQWKNVFSEEYSKKVWNRIEVLADQKPLVIWNN